MNKAFPLLSMLLLLVATASCMNKQETVASQPATHNEVQKSNCPEQKSAQEEHIIEWSAVLSMTYRYRREIIIEVMNEMKTDLELLRKAPETAEALIAFSEAFDLHSRMPDPRWRNVEKTYGHLLRRYTRVLGYYDVFLITPEGDVVFTAEMESDFGRNLVTGELASGPAGKCFQNSLNGFYFQDMQMYATTESPAMFMGAPVYANEVLAGVVMFQIPLDKINLVTIPRIGLGDTGEVNLVGSDFLMRSDSFLDPVNHSVKASFLNPEKGSINNDAAIKAIAGESGIMVTRDYNNNEVLSAYGPVDVLGKRWGILVEVDIVEASTREVKF